MDPVSVVVAVGIPALAVLFYFDGLVVGKVFQPTVIFVGYVTVTTPPLHTLTVLFLICIVAATVGQWTVYRGCHENAPEYIGVRRTVPYLDTLPTRIVDRLGDRRMGHLERVFDRYGGIALCVTNAIPGIRSLMSVVAGLSAYPRERFLLLSGIGNALYFLLLIAISWGLIGVIERFLPL